MITELILALTIWAEARGEGIAGQCAVASIIWNRASRPAPTPLSLKAVCLKPKQFSCWNGKRGEKLIYSNPIGKEWEYCQYLADQMVIGEFEPSNDATHYLTNKLYNSDRCPKWVKKMQVVCIVGNHIFLRGY